MPAPSGAVAQQSVEGVTGVKVGHEADAVELGLGKKGWGGEGWVGLVVSRPEERGWDWRGVGLTERLCLSMVGCGGGGGSVEVCRRGQRRKNGS
jgi:hypothetical protein